MCGRPPNRVPIHVLNVVFVPVLLSQYIIKKPLDQTPFWASVAVLADFFGDGTNLESQGQANRKPPLAWVD